jgi:hypothetical protein
MTFRTTTEILLRGSLAGLAGTVAMSAVMLAAKRTGLMGKMPPERITEAGLRLLHVKPSEPAENALATVAHLGYGAGGGVVFSIAARNAKAPLPGPIVGALFGLLLWGGSYAGWIPAVGILPPPHRDRRQRQASMVVAHLVYGSVLGALLARRRTTN